MTLLQNRPGKHTIPAGKNYIGKHVAPRHEQSEARWRISTDTLAKMVMNVLVAPPLPEEKDIHETDVITTLDGSAPSDVAALPEQEDVHPDYAGVMTAAYEGTGYGDSEMIALAKGKGAATPQVDQRDIPTGNYASQDRL